jgi:hypothetical protein
MSGFFWGVAVTVACIYGIPWVLKKVTKKCKEIEPPSKFDKPPRTLGRR